MPNLDDLRSILAARYEIEIASPQDQPPLQDKFDALVDAVLKGTNCTRNTFLEAIADRYRSYRRERYKAENRRQP